jgi:hypothetical protein
MEEELVFSSPSTFDIDNFIGWITSSDKSKIQGALTTGTKYFKKLIFLL